MLSNWWFLVDKSLKLNHELEIYQRDISKRLGVDVYQLDGEPFYGFVRSLSLKDKNKKGEETYVYSQKERLGYSFSYVSGHEIGTIDPKGNGIILYYDNIDYQNIMYVHHTDMHTGAIKKLNT